MNQINSTLKFVSCGVLILATLAAVASNSNGQDSHPAALKTFVTSDVVGIGYVDLKKVDLDESFDLLGKLGFDEGNSYQRMKQQLLEINKDIDKLKDAGLSRGYILFRTADIQDGGTSFVFPLKDGTDRDKANEVFDEMFSKMAGEDSGYQTGFRNDAYFVGTGEGFERLKNEVADDNADRSEMWSAIRGRSFGFVLFGDKDSRMVVSELMPPLPGPFAKLDGELVAENTKWAAVSLKLDSSPELNVQIEASNESSAQTYKEVIDDALKMAKFLPQVREVIPKSEIKFVFNSIAPTQEGSRITMSASKLTEDLDRLAKVVAVPVKQVRRAAIQTQMLNSLRQHCLAMLNYESAYRHFPAQYSVDEEGKPLLSWRVHVLPFLEQGELYKQFKLDEPWDSDHNIKLVKLMPAIFYDQRKGSNELNDEGKTVFQVPAGDGLVFHATKESQFRDLTDGSSNTIALVALPKAHAVEWTKPTDWQVDLTKPYEKLKGEGAERVLTAFCDGSTHSIEFGLPADELRKLIDPADGEVVDFEAGGK